MFRWLGDLLLLSIRPLSRFAGKERLCLGVKVCDFFFRLSDAARDENLQFMESFLGYLFQQHPEEAQQGFHATKFFYLWTLNCSSSWFKTILINPFLIDDVDAHLPTLRSIPWRFANTK